MYQRGLMMTSELYEVQKALEQQMLMRGAHRYLANRERLIENGDSAAHGPHKKLIEDALPRVSSAILKWVQDLRSNGDRGKRPAALAVVEALDPDRLAAIGLTTCFNTLRGGDVRKTCWYIGQAVEAEVWSDEFQEKEPKLFERLVRRAKAKHSRTDLRMRSVKVIARKAGYEGTEWSSDYRIKIGEPILNAVLEASEVFHLETNEDDSTMVVLTPDAYVAIMVTEELQQWMQPVAFPMVVPPRPWTSATNGGYLSREFNDGRMFRLIRTFDPAALRLLNEHIKSGVAKPFLDGINALQATPFAINKRVMEMVEWAFDEGLTIKKLPRRDPLPKVVFPDDYEELDWKQQKGWRLKAAEVATINRGIMSEAAGFRQDVWMAHTLAEFSAFYLPHNVDFRGRIYPIPHFNNQRADYIRGMIQFAEGKPLGATGDKWLLIHLANCGDFEKVSKKSFDARRQWVNANHDRILAVAQDPKTNRWWTEADAPFQFLAACFEYADWCRLGSAFVSHLPIALDGSNSGLQHYSAALRAEDDGRHVNLVPQEKPADIYQAVADLATSKVEAERGEALADLWLKHGVTRSVVKRNVMTFAYSSETFGFKQQLIDDLMTPLHHQVLLGDLPEHPFGDQSFAAAGYLAKKVFASVNETVSKAGEGMKFLQKVAGVLAHERKPMIWTTPVGFPVIHRYSEFEIKRIELFLYDRSIKVGEGKHRVTETGGVLRRILANTRIKPKDTINKSKQKSAVAPNVIHSLDAAHLLGTVNRASAEGMNAFCMIHDSFAVHAADTERFFGIIRDEMVEMYSKHDPFSEIYSAACAALSDKGRDKLPVPPSKGSLDLDAIRSSLYCFA
jgi:DNA-directed RNA polymerase